MIGNFLLDKADNALERRSGGDGCEDEPYASFIVRRRVRQRNHSIKRPTAAVAALLPHINPLWPLCHFLSSVFFSFKYHFSFSFSFTPTFSFSLSF